MTRNILKSKLFVLCSMLFCSLAVSVFFFGSSSKAAGSISVGVQNLQNDIYDKFGDTINDTSATNIINAWVYYNDYNYLVFWKGGSNSYSAIFCKGYTINSSNNVVIDAGGYYRANQSNINSFADHGSSYIYIRRRNKSVVIRISPINIRRQIFIPNRCYNASIRTIPNNR